MRGDFSRDTFEPEKHFTRVLMQQGRPLIDADWNEQTAILWHHWRTLVTDLIGPFGGPAQDCGFGLIGAGDFPLRGVAPREQHRLRKLLKDDSDLLISPGAYYVNGIRCSNDAHTSFSDQAVAADAAWAPRTGVSYFAYLDVWERSVGPQEDPDLRDPALGGADSGLRGAVTWRVRVRELTKDLAATPTKRSVAAQWSKLARVLAGDPRGCLKPIVPDGYRGLENHLYRIEVHRGGSVGSEPRPTFKWSRQNGSAAWRVRNIVGSGVSLDEAARDLPSALTAGDVVEIVAPGRWEEPAGALWRVREIPAAGHVSLEGTPPGRKDGSPLLLRRWDHAGRAAELHDGAVPLREGAAIAIEDGLAVEFEPTDPPHRYRSGDYWLIAARPATHGILWPERGGTPVARPPHGIGHHFAPLAILRRNGSGALAVVADCRVKFKLPA